MLSPSAIPELQVPDAHPAERDEGAGGTEESPAPRLLQHPQGERAPGNPASTLFETGSSV